MFISPWWSNAVRNVLLENDVGGNVRTGYYGFRVAAGDPEELCQNVAFKYNSALSTFLINCTKTVNVVMEANVGPYVPWACYDGITYDHNVWDGAQCGRTDLNAPSGFVDPQNSDLHLKEGAAAINHGNPKDYPKHDLDGQKRPQGRRVDAGAYEYEMK